MASSEDILIENLKEAIKAFERFLRAGLTATAYLLVLAFTNPTVSDEGGQIKVPIVSLDAPPVVVGLFAMALFWVAGFIAFSLIGSVERIKNRLVSEDSKLLDAVLTYPSILTLRRRWVRSLVAVSPGVLGMLAYFLFYYRLEGASQTLQTMPIFALPYILLAIRMYRNWTPTFKDK